MSLFGWAVLIAIVVIGLRIERTRADITDIRENVRKISECLAASKEEEGEADNESL